MEDLEVERRSLLSNLRILRFSSVVLGLCNVAIILTAGVLVGSLHPGCSGADRLALAIISLVAVVRIVYMVAAGKAQQDTAESIVRNVLEGPVDVDSLIRYERRMRYKKWLWWTRFGMLVTALQFLVALFLLCVFAKDFSTGTNANNNCLSGNMDGNVLAMLGLAYLHNGLKDTAWKKILFISFLILVWLVVIIQCSTGSDVLKWRSFYATHDAAWKAHYREVFDHGIREVLCCLGRAKYLSVLEEDEVYSVARLLGDLVAYRASGTGHLELLAGLALLQKHKPASLPPTNFVEAPDVHLHEAAALHQFAEASYTGPLLDFGRNPILFPCAWLHRQGVLCPWARTRRPKLEGDNWWRGHAAAFLKYVNMPPEALRRGRVNQTKCEAAYFVIVIHNLKSIVISVRGTETPEDLLTDGLCRNCTLSTDDLDGIINSDQLPENIKESVLSSFPHYGHSGIVECARELFMQIDGQPHEKVLMSGGIWGADKELCNLDWDVGLAVACAKEVSVTSEAAAKKVTHRWSVLRRLCLDVASLVPGLTGSVEQQHHWRRKSYGFDLCLTLWSGLTVKLVQPGDDLPSKQSGFLASLVGVGCECYGYKIRIVGHSLGGSVAAVLGLRLFARYPNLHVYSYGPLPCVDSVVAEACSKFVTCIVYNDEFSARLSVNSILRLRAAAIGAISTDSLTNSGMIPKIVSRILPLKRLHDDEKEGIAPAPVPGEGTIAVIDSKPKKNHLKYTIKGSVFLCSQAVSCVVDMPMPNHGPRSHFINGNKTSPRTSQINGAPTEELELIVTGNSHTDQQLYHDGTYIFDESSSEFPREGNHSHLSAEVPFESPENLFHCGDRSSSFMGDQVSCVQNMEEKYVEVYIPGLVIHIIRIRKNTSPMWKSWITTDAEYDYKAFLANRESFKDIVVSPYMFLDHLPWRCHYAIQKALGTCKYNSQDANDLSNEENEV
ncbi:hypothetical protein ZIOFF_030335 [Zingiber officinale]|uniref:Fungal lipase-like domain-containing protein n=1 Tax=Zingiber officinale TaxID=94328 RepID=A0A8J5H3U4_ZINOF|nr:hypothetical protein ZIOFF_030335 [Zingiber officinale]